MNIQQFVASILKTSVISTALVTSLCAYAGSPSYKGDSASNSVMIERAYKGESEPSEYAMMAAPSVGKYGGQVYDSDLYGGSLSGPGYSLASTRSLHDGFYVGLEAGYDSYKVRNNINTIQGGSSVFQESPELNAVGMSYSFVGGFGRYFDPPLYIGTELFYNTSQANTTANIGLYNGQSGIYNIQSNIVNSYGGNLVPGIKLNDSTLFYLKGGYTRLEVRTYETSGALSVNNAQSNGVNGFHFGLGLEVNLYKNWSVRGEYTHLNCGNFTTTTGTRVSPSDNQVMFGVIFHVV